MRPPGSGHRRLLSRVLPASLSQDLHRTAVCSAGPSEVRLSDPSTHCSQPLVLTPGGCSSSRTLKRFSCLVVKNIQEELSSIFLLVFTWQYVLVLRYMLELVLSISGLKHSDPDCNTVYSNKFLTYFYRIKSNHYHYFNFSLRF